jgi:hypothetical protein
MFTPEDVNLQLIYHLVKKEVLHWKVQNPSERREKKPISLRLLEN